MSVIAKGYVFRLRYSLTKGAALRHTRIIDLPRLKWLYLHDPTGRDLPTCAIIIQRAMMDPARKARKPSSDARRYFGDIPIGEMPLAIPAVKNVDWSTIGYCRQIYYDRISERLLEQGGDPYQHPYRESRDDARNAILLTANIQREKFFLLDLGTSCIVNARGFVAP